MSQRKFAIGDRVRLTADSYSVNNPYDTYTISRMLPADANVWQYRMKRVGDGQERAATELQIVKMVSEERTGGAPTEEPRGPGRARNLKPADRALRERDQAAARRARRDHR